MVYERDVVWRSFSCLGGGGDLHRWNHYGAMVQSEECVGTPFAFSVSPSRLQESYAGCGTAAGEFPALSSRF